MLHHHFTGASTAPGNFALLGIDTDDRPEAEVVVHGTLPPGLNGTLFRNGPGRFRRDGRTKRTLLDGDGAIQRLRIGDGRAYYSRRFVRTPKFVAEEKAGRFLFPTWTTRAPGLTANVGGRIQSQAGVTTYSVNGRLLALDEQSAGFELDGDTLDTVGAASLGLPGNDERPLAHAKRLATSGDWIFASTRAGMKGMKIDLVRHRKDGTRAVTPTVNVARMGYVHDFAVTERFAVFTLQAVRLHAVRFLAGMASFSESLEWAPQDGNIVLVIELATGAVRSYDAPATWLWHVANAYDHGRDLILDFVGYDDPFHFLGANAQLAAIMKGQHGDCGAPGTIRRYVLGPDGRFAEMLLADGNFEFPSIDWRATGIAHNRIYATAGQTGGILHTGVAALDLISGKLDCFDFGPHVNVGEPVFVSDRERDEGWLIVQTLDARRTTSAFAILDTRAPSDGPVATIDLGEPVPISFHGHWVAG